jgi:hypothetical protein
MTRVSSSHCKLPRSWRIQFTYLLSLSRGKKIFREFDDDDTTNHATTGDNEQEEDTWSDLEIRRRAGRPAASSSKDRPFMRSSYKPRLLFPTEEQRRAREEAAADEADEEALTDIEVPIPQQTSSSPRRGKAAAEATTPMKHRARAVTPPTTIRKTRGRKLFDHSPLAAAPDAMDVSPGEVTVVVDDDEAPLPDDQVSVASSKKNSPFDTWRRTKAAGVSKAAGKKREAADALEAEGLAAAASSAKRSRGLPLS